MSSQHYTDEQERIIFSVFYDTVEIDEILQCFHCIDEFIEKHDLPMVYWIGDTTTVNITRDTLLKAVDATVSGTNGSGGDPRVIPIIIMNPDIHAYFVSEFRNRYHWANFPIFPNAFQAYAFVRMLNQNQL